MSNNEEHMIYLDNLSEILTLTDEGADATFPDDIDIALDVKWHAPEPDVGIDYSQPEITDVEYHLNGETFKDQAKFIDALYLIIGEWIEEDIDALTKVIDKIIDDEELDE